MEEPRYQLSRHARRRLAERHVPVEAMKLELEESADAAYVRVIERGTVARTRPLDPQRILDYNSRGEIVGIEFLAVSKGVNLDDLPFHDELARLFRRRGFPVFA